MVGPPKKWFQRKYDDCTIIRSKTETVEDLSQFDAEYCTFTRVWKREGNDAVAFGAAKSWCTNAIRAWESKETFHGHPYVGLPEPPQSRDHILCRNNK